MRFLSQNRTFFERKIRMYKKYVVVEGNAYSRGVQIGKELKNQISINYQNQTKYYRDKEDFNYRKWGDIAKRYIPAMEKWTPEVVDEIRGMAEGAQMELEQILALTTAYEKSFSRDMISEKCTSFIGAESNICAKGNCRSNKRRMYIGMDE